MNIARQLEHGPALQALGLGSRNKATFKRLGKSTGARRRQEIPISKKASELTTRTKHIDEK